MYLSLQSYFLTLELELRIGIRVRPEKLQVNKLIGAFSNSMTEVSCLFFDGALPVLMNLNLMLPRTDPTTHLLYDALFNLHAKRRNELERTGKSWKKMKQVKNST